MTSVLLAHRDHLPAQPLPTGSQEPWWVWSPRATFYIADVPWWVWRRGQLSLPARMLSRTPPPQHLHFKENPLHMFPIHLHFNSPWGGQRAGHIAPKPLTS